MALMRSWMSSSFIPFVTMRAAFLRDLLPYPWVGRCPGVRRGISRAGVASVLAGGFRAAIVRGRPWPAVLPSSTRPGGSRSSPGPGDRSRVAT
jgi:hypothetical protein